MRKIPVTDYTVSIHGQDQTYPMREALAEVLFHPALAIVALDLLKRDDLARRILGETEDVVLLEEAEYAMVKAAVNKVDTFTRTDVEFVRRVLDAQMVTVMEK
jgi:hypothetical protein